MTRDEALAVFAMPLKPNEAQAATIGDYMLSLALEVWREGEGFSGKRPFGNSGWGFDIYDVFPDQPREKTRTIVIEAFNALIVRHAEQ